jgi:hypothetical protein
MNEPMPTEHTPEDIRRIQQFAREMQDETPDEDVTFDPITFTEEEEDEEA